MPLPESISIVPYHLMNYSVLTSTATESINLSSSADIPSPLSSCPDDEDVDLEPEPASKAILYTIKTNFDPSLERNTKVDYTTENRHEFTAKERGLAKAAINCESLEDITIKVGDYYCYIFSSKHG